MILDKIHAIEYDRISHDLHQNIHGFLDEVKCHMATIEEEIRLLETYDLASQMDALIEEAYKKVLRLKLGG